VGGGFGGGGGPVTRRKKKSGDSGKKKGECDREKDNGCAATAGNSARTGGGEKALKTRSSDGGIKNVIRGKGKRVEDRGSRIRSEEKNRSRSGIPPQ